MRAYSRLPVMFFVAVLAGAPLGAQTITTAGDFSVEPPTLLSLGFDWKITGDDNRNAQVDLTYRKKGETAWKKGLPLLRLQREWVNGGPPLPTDDPFTPRFPFDYVVPNMFSGSALNLEPDTEYECRLVLSDPDGVRGEAAKTVSLRTRREPQPAAGGKTYHVYPVGWAGPKQEPAFTGPMSAYYMGTSHYDYQNAWPARVKPGDVILVPVFAVGTYTNYSTSDYNAFRPWPGKDGSFEWNTPPAGVAADYKSAPVVHRFKTLKEYSDATGQEKHSVLVEYDVFSNVTMPDKTDPQRLYKPDGLDFRLRPGSAAVDAGVALPSINDDFTGRAPDIGAYETGRPVPQYGPR